MTNEIAIAINNVASAIKIFPWICFGVFFIGLFIIAWLSD